MRLFLCDDNSEYRVLARVVLEREDFEVVGEAGDGEEALASAPACGPDVVVLDLNMPRMNGHEALPLLRDALPESTKIVVLTSGRAEDERERALAGGADGFVVKPESVFALGAELRLALRRDAA